MNSILSFVFWVSVVFLEIFEGSLALILQEILNVNLLWFTFWKRNSSFHVYGRFYTWKVMFHFNLVNLVSFHYFYLLINIFPSWKFYFHLFSILFFTSFIFVFVTPKSSPLSFKDCSHIFILESFDSMIFESILFILIL